MAQNSMPCIGPISDATVHDVCGDRELPPLGLIEQQWETDPISSEDIEEAAATAAGNFSLDGVPRGGSVAIGAGSRGIANLSGIIRGVVEEFQNRGYKPFVFPAMGSHGGATAEGQREKLAALGVTEETVSCEIQATMSVETIGETPDRGVPVFADTNAVAADAIVPVNRIKPHTDFEGPVESGLSKMLVIGMGKQAGAKIAHEWAIDWSLRNMIPEIASLLVEELPVVGGVAIVEDQRDHTAIIEGVPPSEFLSREAELLETAYEIMPRLPFDDLDILIIDQMGKDISGTGMDTNVVGRRPYAINEPEPETPNIKRIYVRSLTPASHGNAAMVGMADFIHEQLLDEMDESKAFINALTASCPRGVRTPPAVKSDEAALLAAISSIGVKNTDEMTVLRITDTMRLEQLYASKELVERARDNDNLTVISEPEPVSFDDGQFAAPAPVYPKRE
jgi:hypothetical protein